MYPPTQNVNIEPLKVLRKFLQLNTQQVLTIIDIINNVDNKHFYLRFETILPTRTPGSLSLSPSSTCNQRIIYVYT